MSRFFDDSPSKKPKPGQSGAGAGGAAVDGYKAVGELVPDRVCPVEGCGSHLCIKHKNSKPFIVCAANSRDDPNSCQFTANKFGKDRARGDSKIACVSCGVPVEHVISLGKPTGAIDPSTNKQVYDNVHVFFDDCLGKRGTDPVNGKTVLAHCTQATVAIIGTDCVAYEKDKVYIDLKEGCTGLINKGDTVVRSWALNDPPKGFHARCAKRKHAALVSEIIATKKFRKTAGTTAEEEAKAPSVEISADLEDF